MAEGKIMAIRVQNLTTLEWFEWNFGQGWTKTPVAEVGTAIYIAAYVQNVGLQGVLTLEIHRGVTTIATKQEDVLQQGSMGIETSVDGANPILYGTTAFSVVVSPAGDTINFTVYTPDDLPQTTLPLILFVLIALAVLLVFAASGRRR